MIKSIQHFHEEGKKIENIFDIYSGDMTKIVEMVYRVGDSVLEPERDRCG